MRLNPSAAPYMSQYDYVGITQDNNHSNSGYSLHLALATALLSKRRDP